MNSLLQTEKECYICHTTLGLEKHHIYAGSRRKAADKWGCWVWLCHEHHTGRFGVQYDLQSMRELQKRCQLRFEQIYGHEKFMDIFGKGYVR